MPVVPIVQKEPASANNKNVELKAINQIGTKVENLNNELSDKLDTMDALHKDLVTLFTKLEESNAKLCREVDALKALLEKHTEKESKEDLKQTNVFQLKLSQEIKDLLTK
jgi:hypothetical protein